MGEECVGGGVWGKSVGGRCLCVCVHALSDSMVLLSCI